MAVTATVIQKYIKTIKCGCGSCRYRSRSTSTWACPLEKSPDAIWLWSTNPEYLKTRKYTVEEVEEISEISEVVTQGVSNL